MGLDLRAVESSSCRKLSKQVEWTVPAVMATVGLQSHRAVCVVIFAGQRHRL